MSRNTAPFAGPKARQHDPALPGFRREVGVSNRADRIKGLGFPGGSLMTFKTGGFAPCSGRQLSLFDRIISLFAELGNFAASV